MTKQAITFRIPDMHCEGCAQRLTNVLERIEGVRAAHVRFENKTAEVDYDADRADQEAMKQAVEKAGYTFEPVG